MKKNKKRKGKVIEIETVIRKVQTAELVKEVNNGYKIVRIGDKYAILNHEDKYADPHLFDEVSNFFDSNHLYCCNYSYNENENYDGYSNDKTLDQEVECYSFDTSGILSERQNTINERGGEIKANLSTGSSTEVVVWKWFDVIALREGGKVCYQDKSGKKILNNVRRLEYPQAKSDCDAIDVLTKKSYLYPYTEYPTDNGIIQTFDFSCNPKGDDFVYDIQGKKVGVSRRTVNEHIGFISSSSNLVPMQPKTLSDLDGILKTAKSMATVYDIDKFDELFFKIPWKNFELDTHIGRYSRLMGVVINVIVPKGADFTDQERMKLKRVIGYCQNGRLAAVGVGESVEIKKGYRVIVTEYDCYEFIQGLFADTTKNFFCRNYSIDEILDMGFLLSNDYMLALIYWLLINPELRWRDTNELYERIIEKGAEVQGSDLLRLYMEFCDRPDLEAVEWLASHGADINAVINDCSVLDLSDNQIQDYLLSVGAKKREEFWSDEIDFTDLED